MYVRHSQMSVASVPLILMFNSSKSLLYHLVASQDKKSVPHITSFVDTVMFSEMEEVQNVCFVDGRYSCDTFE